MRLVAMQTGLPDLIDVRAATDARSRAARGTVATGFSGGVDSFWVVARHIGSDVPIGTRLTHLLSNNVGSSGRGVAGRALWARRAGRVRLVADSLGLPLVTVDSNLADFHRTTFPRSHSLRNMAVALLLQAGIDRFLLAGTFEFPDIRIRQGGDSAHVEPVLIPLLSTGSLRAVSVGGSTGRVGRTREVAAFPASWTALDVCISSTPPPTGPVNCSRCWKCLRTLVTLDAIGELDRYTEVFDLGVHRAHRRTYVLSMTRRKALEREILDHARESGHDLGLGPLGRSLRVLAERLPRRLPARAARLAHTALTARRAALTVQGLRSFPLRTPLDRRAGATGM